MTNDSKYKLAMFKLDKPHSDVIMFGGSKESKVTGAIIKLLEPLTIYPKVGYVLPLCVPSSYLEMLQEATIKQSSNDLEFEIMYIYKEVSLYIINPKSDKVIQLNENDILCELKGESVDELHLPEPVSSTELTESFYDMLSKNIDYWGNQDCTSTKDRLQSTIFSVLADMDGGGMSDGFVVSGYGCFENTKDSLENGLTYSLPDTILHNDGALHETWYPFLKDKTKT